jgi:hypothetical protein
MLSSTLATLDLQCKNSKIHQFFIQVVAPDIAAALKIVLLNYGKRTDIWHLVLLREKILFEESPPSIMVTRNLNWSTEIL